MIKELEKLFFFSNETFNDIQPKDQRILLSFIEHKCDLLYGKIQFQCITTNVFSRIFNFRCCFKHEIIACRADFIWPKFLLKQTSQTKSS
jgi:hypothetical protein